MLDNIESEYPGYDEYRVNADEIEHDPYVLISILSAWHEGVFTLDEVQSTLEMLFEKQYILTVEEEVQVRYRTETRTDSEGNPYTVEVPYNYYILHVDLENFNLSHVPVYIMGEEQLSMYAMYMSSLGNRPDLFPQSGYVSKYYENPPADYEVPAALLGSDEKFARLMEEADKYVGFPYSERHNRKIVFAYLLLPGINDRPSDVRQLAKWFRGKKVMINVLQYNPTSNSRIKAPQKREIVAFKHQLEQAGLEVTMRVSHGREINAACGQLANTYNKFKKK